jgi:hypothetical protein
MLRQYWTGIMVAAVLLPVSAGGCSKRRDAPQFETVEGVIERIDLPNSEVTLRYYNRKRDREVSITGKATAETEIYINGVLSALADLREGERVSVVGRIEGSGPDREVVATRVDARRAETVRRQPATTTAPTEEGPSAPAP